MKKFCVAFLIIAVFLSLSACTSYKALEGNWDTVELLKNSEALPVYESNIKFIIDGNWICSNFYEKTKDNGGIGSRLVAEFQCFRKSRPGRR